MKRLDSSPRDPRRTGTARRSRGRVPSPVITLMTAVVVALVWEIAGRAINPLFASYPTAIAQAFVESAASGELATATLSSLQPFLVGLGLAIVVGIALGVAIGESRVVEAALGPYVIAAYSMPLVALIPLFVLWFGLGFTVKVAVVFTLGVFPVIINTWDGVRAVSKSLIEVGTAFDIPRATVVRAIIVPGTIPSVMTGLRLAVGRSVIAVVVAEFFTAISGLGELIIRAGNNFDTAAMFVPILVLMAIGAGLTQLVGVVERRVAPWQRGLTGR